FGGDNPGITPDGRYIVFEYDGDGAGTPTNLCANPPTCNQTVTNPESNFQIYRADTNTTPPTVLLISGTNATTACSDGDNTQALSFAVGARVSADGNRIVFQSACNNLVPNYTRNKTLNAVNTDVYIRDVNAGTTKLISKAAGAAAGQNPAGNGASGNVDIT